jgi:CopG family transcriptional regulator, nickel-responsive regulator
MSYWQDSWCRQGLTDGGLVRRGKPTQPSLASRRREASRAGLQQSAEDAAPSGHCVAALIYVYDHAARDLSKRLVQNFHGHHDLSLATLHVHLDGDSCMEITALKGSSGEVRHFADHIIVERGVRYGRVVMIPTSTAKLQHAPKSRHRHA